ncbi:MAG: hypothetical protein WC516_04105 [Patescibacteria group bacterium]
MKKALAALLLWGKLGNTEEVEGWLGVMTLEDVMALVTKFRIEVMNLVRARISESRQRADAAEAGVVSIEGLTPDDDEPDDPTTPAQDDAAPTRLKRVYRRKAVKPEGGGGTGKKKGAPTKARTLYDHIRTSKVTDCTVQTLSEWCHKDKRMNDDGASLEVCKGRLSVMLGYLKGHKTMKITIDKGVARPF